MAREELGLEVRVRDRLGVYSHFSDTSSVTGLDSRHTVDVVYRVEPAGREVELDDQHDDYRWVDGVESWMHDSLRQYLEDAAIFV